MLDIQSHVSVGRAVGHDSAPPASGARHDIVGPALHEPDTLIEHGRTSVSSLRAALRAMGKSRLGDELFSRISLGSPDTKGRAETMSNNKAVRGITQIEFVQPVDD